MRHISSGTVALWILLVLGLVLGACAGENMPSRLQEQAKMVEQRPAGPLPAREAPDLRADRSRVSDVEERKKEELTECFVEINTFVRDETGHDCDTYKAEIAGGSVRCVTRCDSGARLAEAIASAQTTCANFCRQKNCPGPRYSPPDACAARDCYAGDDRCNRDWPLFDYCYLLNVNRVWNCICLEV